MPGLSGVTGLSGLSGLFGGAFLPTDLDGLLLWYKADTDTFQDSAKITPATNDGDVIGAWVDQSGNDNDALQTVTANKPTLQLDEQNGLPAIQFDTTDDDLEHTPFSLSDEMTIYVVIKQIQSISVYIGAVSSTDRIQLNAAADDVTAEFSNIQTVISVSEDLQTNVYEIFGFIRDVSDNLTTYLNGTDITTGSPSNANIFDLRFIGNVPSSFNTALLSELLVYNAALSATDRETIETYLNERYAIF